MRFYLGTHQVAWLGRTNVPLFLSHRRLAPRRTLPRAIGPWALDSGGFSELSLHRYWTIEPRDYVAAVRRYATEIGGLQWAAIQDMMCEPEILARTRLSVEHHQRATCASLVELRMLAPEIPWLPVLQGWCWGEHQDHVDMYARFGIDLTREPIVGVGTICRRQHTLRASLLLADLARMGLQLHGFGFKVNGLRSLGGRLLASSDSLAWSFNARRNPGIPGHDHASCANCLDYALAWRARMLDSLAEPDDEALVAEDIRASIGPAQLAMGWA